jgi:hypothetical protein
MEKLNRADSQGKLTGMVALRSNFDGEKIEVPAELRGAAPGEVLIVYPANEQATAAGGKSIWDAFGKAAHPRTAEEINAQVRAERDAWGAR